jgi:hypothetical protein
MTESNKLSPPDPGHISSGRRTPVAVAVHLRPHGVQAAEFGRGIRHCSTVMADFERRSTTCAVGDPSAFDSDAVIDLDEGDHLTDRVPAAPSRLTPDQSGLVSEARQFQWFDAEPVVMPRSASAASARRRLNACRYPDPEPSRPITSTFDVDVSQPEKPLTYARSTIPEQGLLRFLRRKTSSDPLSPCIAQHHLPDPTFRSEAPS